MSFHCGLSDAKISASVMVNEKRKHQYQPRIFLLPLKMYQWKIHMPRPVARI